jgi:GTP cyclohydrolase II
MSDHNAAADLMAERQIETEYGRWLERLYRYSNTDVVVLCYGRWNESSEPLVRIHSACFAAHYLASAECDCRAQLEIAYERIVTEGVGIVVFLDQDGRGNGHAALMRAAVYAERHGCTQSDAYSALGYPPDSRTYVGAAVVLRKMGLRAARLMTNNLNKLNPLLVAGINARPARIVAPHAANPRFKDLYRLKAAEGYLIDNDPGGHLADESSRP